MDGTRNFAADIKRIIVILDMSAEWVLLAKHPFAIFKVEAFIANVKET